MSLRGWAEQLPYGIREVARAYFQMKIPATVRDAGVQQLGRTQGEPSRRGGSYLFVWGGGE